MKKWIALILFLICVLAMVGCGANEQTTADTPNATIQSSMYEGNLNRTTGKQIPAEVDESAIVGEANFGQVGDPYAITRDGLLVIVNNEWTVFELLEAE